MELKPWNTSDWSADCCDELLLDREVHSLDLCLLGSSQRPADLCLIIVCEYVLQASITSFSTVCYGDPDSCLKQGSSELHSVSASRTISIESPFSISSNSHVVTRRYREPVPIFSLVIENHTRYMRFLLNLERHLNISSTTSARYLLRFG